MNIWATLRRILAKHFAYHMAIPLFVGAAVEVLRLMYTRGAFSVSLAGFFTPGHIIPAFSDAFAGLLTLEHILPVLAVIIAYLLVIITNEADTPFEIANFTRVEQALLRATSYFALCDIPMREWFEPGAFKYFSLLLSKRQSCGGAFRYDRVIVFTTPARKRDAEATVLDRYHAEALATAHRRLKIPMGWVGANELQDILLHDVAPEHRMLFRHVPARWRWAPAFVLQRCSWPVQLDFAIIDRPEGKAVIIVPFKKADATVLEGDAIVPYETLAASIRAKVYEPDGKKVRLDHDFPRLLGVC
jgi:hypothetical protein